MDVLKLECELLVCIPAGIGFQQHVMFRPTDETVKAVREAVKADIAVRLEVTDEAGDSTSKRLHIPVIALHERSSLILTTREL